MHARHPWTILLASFLILPACGGESCPTGFFDIGGVCIDLTNDPSNCGSLGNVCPRGQVCEEGRCILSCMEGSVPCEGVCRDLASDEYNCGSCGLACATGYVCTDGSCLPECPDGYTSCSGICKNLANDPSNCGECGSTCPAGEVCSTGSCSFTCPTPYVDCSGSCVDLDTDHLNCGECENACGTGQVCDEGSCTNSCLAGLTLCSGACRDLMQDSRNCGSCGTVCDTGEWCHAGSCVLACVEGLTDCSGSCRDLASDRLNCGSCDNACLEGQVCDDGTCELTCASPLVNCSGFCTDTDLDPQNCGSCSTVCDETNASAYCSSGACGLICHPGFGDCDGDVSTGCETNVLLDRSNCGTCGTVCATDEFCYLGTCYGMSTDCGDLVVQPSEEYDPPPGPFTSVLVDPTSCLWDFSGVVQLYCNGTCTWAGGSSCDAADADLFCKLKTGNPLSTATSFSTPIALSAPGFPCPDRTSLGTSIGPLPLRGVTREVWYTDDDIRATHGAGTVVTDVVCTSP